MPSIAYRLALAAAGDAIAGVSLSGPGAWDYAAGHALLRAAGGTMLDESGSEVSYASGRSSTRFCFGGARAACETLCRGDWSALLSGRSHPVALIRPERGRLIRDPGKLSRAQGCLLGQLAGDSLGGLVEFRGPDEIRRQYPNTAEPHQCGTTLRVVNRDAERRATMRARRWWRLGNSFWPTDRRLRTGADVGSDAGQGIVR